MAKMSNIAHEWRISQYKSHSILLQIKNLIELKFYIMWNLSNLLVPFIFLFYLFHLIFLFRIGNERNLSSEKFLRTVWNLIQFSISQLPWLLDLWNLLRSMPWPHVIFSISFITFSSFSFAPNAGFGDPINKSLLHHLTSFNFDNMHDSLFMRWSKH